MTKVYVYLSRQHLDTCPMTGKAISKSYSEIMHEIKMHEKDSEDVSIASYVFPTDVGGIEIIPVYPSGDTSTFENMDDLHFRYEEEVEKVLTTKQDDLKKIGPVSMAIRQEFISWHDGIRVDLDGDDIEKGMMALHGEEIDIRTELDMANRLIEMNVGGGARIKYAKYKGERLQDPNKIIDILSRIVINDSKGLSQVEIPLSAQLAKGHYSWEIGIGNGMKIIREGNDVYFDDGK